jgi:hypothetical protein
VLHWSSISADGDQIELILDSILDSTSHGVESSSLHLLDIPNAYDQDLRPVACIESAPHLYVQVDSSIDSSASSALFSGQA